MKLIRRGRLGVADSVATDALAGALSATDRSRLSRNLNKLKDKRKIGMFDDWIWLERKTEV